MLSAAFASGSPVVTGAINDIIRAATPIDVAGTVLDGDHAAVMEARKQPYLHI